MKQMISITLLMLMISISLVTYQWLDFQVSLEAKEEQVHMDVDLYEKDNYLTVQIQVNNLSGQEYKVNKPIESEDFQCGQCQVNPSESTLETPNDLSINYRIPLDDEQLYVNNWLPKLYLNDILLDALITVTLTTSHNNSQWYTYKKPIYSESLKKINYYKWKVNGQHNIPLIKLSGPHDTYYINDKVQVISAIPINIEPFKELLNRNFDIHSQLFVINPDLEPVLDHGIALLNYTEKRKIVSALMSTQLSQYLTSNSDSNRMLLNVITSYFYSNEIKSDKAEFMVDELKQSLSEEQKELWLDSLKNKQYSSDDLAVILDQSLNQLGLKSHFFTQNVSTSSFKPFYAVEQRSVKYRGTAVENWSGIIYRGESYLPLRPLLSLTGYHISQTSSEELFIQDNGNRYRFYPERNMYIINELRYQFNDEFLVNLNNDLYIKTISASQIFSFNVDFNEDTIQLIE